MSNKTKDRTLQEIVESDNAEKLLAMQSIVNSLKTGEKGADLETVIFLFDNIRALLKREYQDTGIDI